MGKKSSLKTQTNTVKPTTAKPREPLPPTPSSTGTSTPIHSTSTSTSTSTALSSQNPSITSTNLLRSRTPSFSPLPSSPQQSTPPSPSPSSPSLLDPSTLSTMFPFKKSKKYSPLPISGNFFGGEDGIGSSSGSGSGANIDDYAPTPPIQSRRSRSSALYRKYYLIIAVAGFLALVLLAGGGHKVGKSMGLYGNGVSGKVEGEGEGGIYEELDMGEGEGGYDPESIWGDEDTAKKPTGFGAEEEDPSAYASPPFNPFGDSKTSASNTKSKPKPDTTSNQDGDIEFEEDLEGEEEEEELMHILPVGSASDRLSSVKGGEKSQSKGKGKGKGGDLADFAEIDAEEQDDMPTEKGSSTKTPAHSSNNDGSDNDSDYDEDAQAADSSSSSQHPTSFETDPNPSGTTYCTTSHTEGTPIVQYALTIDAGSTGSRIHSYKFNNCGPTPSLEYETFKQINPGLSSFAKDPTAAAASLDSLMEDAVRVVPEELRHCTPVEVKATAGLRLLKGGEGQAILDEVRMRLETDWPFALGKEESAVEIMDGKDEGVYAWITANYLLGKIGAGTSSSDSTIAVMDLGGASTQIVFEPNFPADSGLALADGDHKYALKFGGRDFTLYQHSYLGYGLMRARRSVNNVVAFTWSFLQPGGSTNVEWDDMDEDVEIPNPCLSKSMRRRVELDPPGRKSVNVTMIGVESGFEACNRVVQLVMAKDAICEVKPCSFNGVYQPSLLDTFPQGQFLALSYFTDRVQPLLKPFQKTFAGDGTDSQTLTIQTLATMAKDVCAGPTVWRKRWGKDKNAMFELEDRPEYCLDLTFMHALLVLGYEIGESRELIVEKKLRGVELGWALGAGIAMVEKSSLVCTA